MCAKCYRSLVSAVKITSFLKRVTVVGFFVVLYFDISKYNNVSVKIINLKYLVEHKLDLKIHSLLCVIK